MAPTVIYHNPRCSKSRNTLALLREHGIEPEIIDYQKHPPSVEELDAICRGLNLAPLQLIRTKEALFQELGLSVNDQRPREEWLRILADNPRLMERPVVRLGDRHALGRPPENILALLGA